jgi:prepilin-type N-terminal cleavage/methylation domain-containing protein
MKVFYLKKPRKGFSLVEVLLAITVFSLIVSSLAGALLYGQDSAVKSHNKARAVFLVEEGLEAVRNIRDGSFATLTNGTFGLGIASNKWTLTGSSDTVDIYTRTINVATVDANTKRVTVTVSWPGSYVDSVSDLTNWATTLAASVLNTGMLVYGDGGTTTDAIKYRVLNNTGLWGTATAAADVDAGSANRALRAVQVYDSATRNEKVMVSRHYNGTTQYIYAQVYNGTTWGNVQLMSNWNANTFLDVQNFDGTYLNNGDFMVVYSDNTNVPKFRIWNGTTWSASSISTQNVGGTQTYIVAKARPGTNEVMIASFTQPKDARTEYFNGGTYVTANWTVHAAHGTNAPVTTDRLVDFTWSPNNSTIGGLLFSNSGTDRSMRMKIWTADGLGSGSWSSAATAPVQGAGADNLGAMKIIGRPGANEFIACNKSAADQIFCLNTNFTPTWSTPTNNIITSTSEPGIERSFDLAYESISGNPALSVYSDNTSTLRLKKYNPSTTTWDASATNVTTLAGTAASVVLIPTTTNNDIMILVSDSSRITYSVIWDGTNNTFYTIPLGYGTSTHGTNGSTGTEFWYDFVWD